MLIVYIGLITFEFFYFKRKNTILIVLLAFDVVCNLIILNTDVVLLDVVNLFFSFILYVAEMIRYAFIKQDNSKLIVLKQKSPFYPINSLDRSYLFFYLSLAFIVVIYLILLFSLGYNLILTIIFIIIIFAITVIYVVHNLKTTLNILNIVYKDLDYQRFVSKVEEIQNNDKIHPETKNYFRMVKHSISIIFNKEEKELIFEPEYKAYRQFYDIYDFHIFLEKEDFDNKYLLIKNKYQSGALSSEIESIKKAYEAIHHQLDIPNIQTLYPYTLKNKYLSGVNLFVQINYYYYRDKEYSIKLYSIFKDNFSQMSLLKDKLEQLFSDNL